MNPAKWKPEHRVALVVIALVVGAIGFWIGYAITRPWDVSSYIENGTADATTWTLLGAFIAGGARGAEVGY
jgi:hypothetical protein